MKKQIHSYFVGYSWCSSDGNIGWGSSNLSFDCVLRPSDISEVEKKIREMNPHFSGLALISIFKF